MKTLGLFGDFGGVYAPETLMPALAELEAAFLACQHDDAFQAEFKHLLARWAGRPTPLYEAKNLAKAWTEQGTSDAARSALPSGASPPVRIFLKREDLLHGGAHKTNNALGQALLAKKMGKTRLIAETGAGQHGVATAMAGALLGLETVVYMGEHDTERQQPNVFRMQLLGTKVVPVTTGTRTLKEAINEAMRDWMTNVRDTHYILGTAAGPHPFPSMVKYFHQCIGDEARAQMLDATGRLPDAVMACVGGGSNAIGIFQGFLKNTNRSLTSDAALSPSGKGSGASRAIDISQSVVNEDETKLIGIEPAGKGLNTSEHGAVLAQGTPGVLHGMRSFVLQTPDGQILPTHSISAGLDYPSVGPEHAYLQAEGLATYESATDDEALASVREVARLEGIILALETAHATAYAKRWVAQNASRYTPERPALVLVNASGRGDKDLGTLMETLQ
ncbi:MAG: tryptophan synthase subunit beta [Vampirovibrionales bacterium]|nr:tryptophan synthase subunit beta [Vampirovibrionales bacterium]